MFNDQSKHYGFSGNNTSENFFKSAVVKDTNKYLVSTTNSKKMPVKKQQKTFDNRGNFGSPKVVVRKGDGCFEYKVKEELSQNRSKMKNLKNATKINKNMGILEYGSPKRPLHIIQENELGYNPGKFIP